ncbi:MAG: NAD(P)/FAD-dependent oxidoreductase [Bordetella sp.]|uniref:NAD(P)/FAD-dependent oxidoreductase n=1 Tax=Bordetella sp. TaxID=28081 RepID=UPI003F7BE76F
MANDYSGVSLWFDALGEGIGPRPPLTADAQVDIAIVGAGYTGLWTAYYLKTLAPDLSIAVVEAETAGYGASGRNGGWLKGSMAGEDKYLAGLPEPIRRAGYRLLHGIVDHVHGILQDEGIECGFHHGGVLFAAARYPEQRDLQRSLLARLYAAGHDESDYRWLDADELTRQVRLRKPYGAIYSPHCAVVNPAQLVRGLARAVERKGVRLYEQTRVRRVGQRRIETEHGSMRANVVVLALEGYCGTLAGYGGYLLPVQSLIVATEPLDAARWDAIGLQDRPAFSDGGRLITYGQRSSDGRMIFGARGAYRFGARPRSDFSLDQPEFAIRKQLMYDLFPDLQGVRVTHGWGGTMGMARQFSPFALMDPGAGIAMAGGYGGGGVGASNLFGRTLADLILERDTELTRMPWALRGPGALRTVRRWEPEPLPWAVYQTIQAVYAWEESLCRAKDAPHWRKALAGRLSDMLGSLLR